MNPAKFNSLVLCLMCLFALLSAEQLNTELSEEELKKQRKYHLPQYKVIDESKYDYEQITNEDIWVYHVEKSVGVKRLDSDMYEKHILNMKKGEKPWWVVVVKAGLD
jgi:hypothetical protein